MCDQGSGVVGILDVEMTAAAAGMAMYEIHEGKPSKIPPLLGRCISDHIALTSARFPQQLGNLRRSDQNRGRFFHASG
jgi:hypothetical protein